MRLAYADPPYPGQAKRHYSKNGDPFEGEVEGIFAPPNPRPEVET